jgi:methionine synthase I (cobalamin-dependent)
LISDIHHGYVAAGARVLKTNTFNANAHRLQLADLSDKVEECNRQAVAIAREAAGRTCAVVGTIGPTGILLAPAGIGSEAEIRRAYEQQAAILVDAGVDALLVETMFDLREALVALEVCLRLTNKPVITTLTFSQVPRGYLTTMGDAAGDALRRLVDAGAYAVGTNCGIDSAGMIPLAARIREHVSTPVLIQPCAGQAGMADMALGRSDSCRRFAEHMVSIAERGVEMIGGCCGTTDEHILEVHRRLGRR